MKSYAHCFQVNRQIKLLNVLSVQDEWLPDGDYLSVVLQGIKSDPKYLNFIALPEAFLRLNQSLEFLTQLKSINANVVVFGGLRGESFFPHLFSPQEAAALVSALAQQRLRSENHEPFLDWLSQYTPDRAVSLSFLFVHLLDSSPRLIFHSKSSISKYEESYRLAAYPRMLSLRFFHSYGFNLVLYPLVCSDFLTLDGSGNGILDRLEALMAKAPDAAHFVSVINCTPVNVGEDGSRSWKKEFIGSLGRLVHFEFPQLFLFSNYCEFPKGPMIGGLSSLFSNLEGAPGRISVDPTHRKTVLVAEADFSRRQILDFRELQF